ncbi:MAG: FemAB family PEP-CTERM system-associated protein [Sulfuricaulis sp.]|nr:FemAB family PEP-CTERM system-associated protein [Sulfuricaulis sp.]
MSTPLSDTSSPGAPTAPQVHRLQPADAARWDEFVMGCPEATFFHRAGWQQVLERAFGHDTYYLYAEINGRIEGILPLGHMRSRLFGNALVSLPFCVYGGVAAMTEAARTALDRAACELAEQLQVDYLEFRNRAPRHGDWKTKDLYVTFRKSLDPDPEKNLLAIPRKQRAMVRKGIDAGLHGALDDDIGRFYDTYADSVRRLGTPVFSKKYFHVLKEVFGADCEVLTITQNDHTISSVMSFYFKDEVLPYYGGGTSAARAVAGNDFMYWELMRRACARGLRVFDYGRSKQGTGPYNFKKNWGFVPEPLHYEYYLVKAKAVPDINPLNPKYRFFIETWKRLPLPLTKVLGPLISKNLG